MRVSVWIGLVKRWQTSTEAEPNNGDELGDILHTPDSDDARRVPVVLARADTMPTEVQLATLGKRRAMPRRYRALVVALEIATAAFLICVLAFAGVYAFVWRGPVSVPFLVPPIEQAINAELGGLNVRIKDAVLQLEPSGGIALRLTDVRLAEADGSEVAHAPLAAVKLSILAMLTGGIAPERVDFIKPRLLLSYSKSGTLSASFTPSTAKPPAGISKTLPAGPAPADPDNDAGSRAPVVKRIDVVHTLSQIFSRARQRADASSYLEAFGFRDASVIFDNAGRRSLWRVPEMIITLKHKKKRSIITGTARIGDGPKPWTVSFRAEDISKTKTIRLNVALSDFVPYHLVKGQKGLTLVKSLRMSAASNVDLTLSSLGDVLSANIRLNLRPGPLKLPAIETGPVNIDGGEFNLRYLPDERRFAIDPSELRWGKNRLRMTGHLERVKLADGKTAWRTSLKSKDAALITASANPGMIAVQSWSMVSVLQPIRDIAHIERLEINAGGATITMSGELNDETPIPIINLAGNLSAMKLATLKGLWPQTLIPDAREWVSKRVRAGHITSGSFLIKSKPGAPKLGTTNDPTDSIVLSLQVEGTDVALRYLNDQPLLRAPKATLKIQDAVMSVWVPSAKVAVAGSKPLVLHNGRFTIPNIFAEKRISKLVLDAAGPLPAVLDLFNRKPFDLLRGMAILPASTQGNVTGHFAVTIPLVDNVAWEQVKIVGQARLRDGGAKAVLGKHNVHGASVTFDISETALQAQGTLLLKNISAKLSWQRIFGAPADRQPPLRLSAVLDPTDREQLGLKTNHMVSGTIPVVLTIRQTATGAHTQHLSADLTGTELILQNVAWRKPPGRRATLEFDIAKGTQLHKVELQNFKIVGDDIAIEGWMGLGADYQLKAFYFPDFSVNIITRMEISGKLRSDGIWQVTAKGPTYDGRALFRSMFSAGQLTEGKATKKSPNSGVDLVADIGTVQGFGGGTIHKVSVRMSKRDGKLTALKVTGTHKSGKAIAAELQKTSDGKRRLLAESLDAGQAFKLIGFYPHIKGGHASLEVHMDGRGKAHKTGILWTRDFILLGDQVVTEVLAPTEENVHGAGYFTDDRRRTQRSQLEFDRMKVPFSVGQGRFILHNSYINGPVLGATMRGTVDFKTRRVALQGTYIPLYGLNSALGGIPLIGEILRGRPGEGIVGITFAVQGPLEAPQAIVNPLSIVTPGIFRQIWEFQPPQPSVEKPKKQRRRRVRRRVPQSSSAPATTSEPAILEGGWAARTKK